MAEVTLRLRHDPRSGVRELIIEYESEDDMLPFEHERDHRAWVESLLGRPLGEVADEVRVERISKGRVERRSAAVAAAAREAEAATEG